MTVHIVLLLGHHSTHATLTEGRGYVTRGRSLRLTHDRVVWHERRLVGGSLLRSVVQLVDRGEVPLLLQSGGEQLISLVTGGGDQGGGGAGHAQVTRSKASCHLVAQAVGQTRVHEVHAGVGHVTGEAQQRVGTPATIIKWCWRC